MPSLVRTFLLLTLLITVLSLSSQAQQPDSDPKSTWDNQLFYGNRVAWGNSSGQWRFSGELQFRLANDLQALDNWYGEVVASYLLNKNIELIPDFRISIRQGRLDYRPGFGVLYKLYPLPKLQIVNQVKYQYDLRSPGENSHGLRAIVFLNFLTRNQNWIPSLAGGPFWSFGKTGLRGIRGYRVGGGASYVFEERHTITLNYFVGADYQPDPQLWVGVFFFQYTFNLRRDYKYLPGKIIIF